jgi:translation initiation factor eIF-2B subunit epsilon
MSAKSSKKPAVDNSIQQQEKLQALVLLDSYSNKLEPFRSTRAECLIPFVGGKTLLDNNIEYLIENQVEEIYLFCTRHHKQIKEHIEERKWRQNHGVEIHFLYNFKCQSLGDAMREIGQYFFRIVESFLKLLKNISSYFSNFGLIV